MAVATAPNVPYNGEYKHNSKSEGVVAVKRALSRAGYMQWGQFTDVWGVNVERACGNFQNAKKLKITKTYTRETHEALEKTHRKGSRVEWAYDRMSIAIMANEHVTPEERAQSRILDSVTWSIMHQILIGYAMYRPFIVYPSYPVNHYWNNDCSGMFAQWYRWGLAPDPHQNHYLGYGNTGSLWEKGEPVSSLKSAEACDAVLYGDIAAGGGNAHVVILRRFTDGVWYAGSHGQESGPDEVRADYRPIVGIRRFPLLIPNLDTSA